MLLVIDVGNTNTVLGLYEGETLRAHWRLATYQDRTPDEWSITIDGLLQMKNIAGDSVDAAIMASVVPPLTGVLAQMIEQRFGIKPLQVGPGIKTGIKILYDNPLEVGADRIVNSVAAYARVAGAAIIVDFGTATTFDALSSHAEYLGGIIVPGLQIAADGLSARAAKLPRVEVRKPPRLIGRNTIHSIQSGLYYGYTTMINGLLARLRAEMKDNPKVLVTGGLNAQLIAELEGVDLIEPNLTLDGLRIIYGKNSGG
ncbi:MAG: type III pantothenate kinase [Acidobacteriota bacterium]